MAQQVGRRGVALLVASVVGGLRAQIVQPEVGQALGVVGVGLPCGFLGLLEVPAKGRLAELQAPLVHQQVGRADVEPGLAGLDSLQQRLELADDGDAQDPLGLGLLDHQVPVLDVLLGPLERVALRDSLSGWQVGGWCGAAHEDPQREHRPAPRTCRMV